MGKYIVELKKNETLYKAATRESDGTAYVCSAIGTPYSAPDLEQVKEEAYLKGLNDGQGVILESTQNNAFNNGYKKCLKDMEQVMKEPYEEGRKVGIKDGMCDAWEAARKIIRMPEGDLLNIFTECYSAVCTALQVLLKYDASEAIEKLKAYEQEKEEQDGLRQNIQTIVDQCGYSLDEIAEVLRKMRENNG